MNVQVDVVYRLPAEESAMEKSQKMGTYRVFKDINKCLSALCLHVIIPVFKWALNDE